MTKQQAIEELLFQSQRHSNIENLRWTNGFLGMLRPFKALKEANFHQIVKAIEVLSDDFKNKTISNETIASIWGICHLGRAWGIYPNGMLQANNLISKEDIEKLENWIEHISYITFCLLDGCDNAVAFEFYWEEYNS